MNKDGSDFKKVASGLRNAVFMATNPIGGEIWVTEMGRDNLGDDLPPDEINIIEEGKNYGWPYFYGKNIKDQKHGLAEPPVDWITEPSYIDLPAHSAPLGLAFVPEGPPAGGWPEEYWNNLIVALHGSWNRTEPTGYKLVRIKLNQRGEFEGMEDFISGWLAKDGKTALGRPVDVIFQSNGMLYISDDKAGVIYKVEYLGNQKNESEISLNNLTDNQPITSGLTVEGKVKGNWFFEASFPVEIYDANNKKLAMVLAQTKENWMTAETISFFAKLNFPKPTTEQGFVVFRKDNPSALPQHDREFRVKVKFSGYNQNLLKLGCVVAGCSGQLCVESAQAQEGGITTCEFKLEYACFQQFGECKRQENGGCAWSQTEKLNSCLAQF